MNGIIDLDELNSVLGMFNHEFRHTGVVRYESLSPDSFLCIFSANPNKDLGEFYALYCEDYIGNLRQVTDAIKGSIDQSILEYIPTKESYEFEDLPASQWYASKPPEWETLRSFIAPAGIYNLLLARIDKPIFNEYLRTARYEEASKALGHTKNDPEKSFLENWKRKKSGDN